tara:strand:+ start:6129 stop:6746 length:618 start_codon:yes stop_codon:yes gene_type:complete
MIIKGMSFSRLNYDSCAYDKAIKQSTAVGDYMTKAPKNETKCFFDTPYMRLDKSQVSTCKDTPMIDIDSELLGLKRTAAKCQESKMPACVMDNLRPCREGNKFMSAEDTKLSNPPCTLRGTGWNRWEWLCKDPQETAEIPFQTLISDKTLAKDNHRPLVPKPHDATNELVSDMSCYTDSPSIKYPEAEEEIPLVHWRSCAEIRRY